MREIIADVKKWGWGWYVYLEHHAKWFGHRFETRKDVLVGVLMTRRGSYQWPFLHVSLVVLLLAGVTSAPILANSYPGALPSQLQDYTPPSAVLTSLDVTEGVETQISQKPRDQVITYAVVSGDTLARIAEQFGVSVDTIKWANDMKRDSLTIGQQLKIPPVTGIVYKVKEGETIYSIAKKLRTDAQKIVNFPFNDFTDQETFALAVGQTLIIPDGVQPEAPAIMPVAPPPIFITGTGKFLWPTQGLITQYPSWYHMAVDIANAAAPGVIAADAGTVSLVEYLRWGYGQHMIIDHGNGYATLYGHMQAIYVKAGDRVARGQVIGKMGSTGRSTGTHLHFEVRKNGAIVNPMGFFK